MKILLKRFVDARKRFAISSSDADKARFESTLAEVTALNDAFEQILAAMEAATGLPPEYFNDLEAEHTSLGLDQIPRRNLTDELITPTFILEDELPGALEAIYRLLPSGWLGNKPSDFLRLSQLSCADNFLSITKGVRPESEFAPVHRLRQTVRVSEDFLTSQPMFDHFAASLLVPTLVQLASSLEHLKEIKGDVSGRIKRIWDGPSPDVDSTIMELLTAAACAKRGRDVEFISESADKSPDFRCHDPFPVVVECKRQRALSDYELSEEQLMRAIFARLRIESQRMGLYGVFHLELLVEASEANANDVVAALVGQRLAAYPARATTHGWGKVEFHELPARMPLSCSTRLYSPILLEEVFGWSTDLATDDGLCCWYENGDEAVVDRVDRPLGLSWRNSSAVALRKRTWAPVNLFVEAFGQVPLGEDGIIYVAFQEGARADIADLRVSEFQQRLQDVYHHGGIRVPIAVLCRLLPRPLGHGRPDLIENGLELCSDLYGDGAWFSAYPTLIFTR